MQNASRSPPAILHCLFDLKEDVAEPDFRHALQAFFEHLKVKGFATELRFMKRQPMPEFGARLPDFAYYSAVGFHDLENEQACYDYVCANSEVVRTLHHAMNSKVKHGAQFFVTADV